MSKNCVAIRHVAFEDLGSWEKNLAASGYSVTYADAGVDDLGTLNPKEIDLLFILGGPIGAYQDKDYPFIKDEIKLLETRLKDDLPTIGICLGCQLIARTLGSRVYPNTQKEIGWSPLSLTPEGLKSPVHYFDQTHMFHWHGDTFDLPSHASLLASTPICKNQIFTYKKNTLAIQCHPEISRKKLEQWWIGHATELETQKISVLELRKQSDQHAQQLETQSHAFLTEWLNHSSD